MSSNKPHQAAEMKGVTEKKNPDGWTFSPRGFNITWGSDDRYWNITESNGEEVAELVQVSWLELTGSTPKLKKGQRYQITFKITMKEGAFGWNGLPVYMMAKIGKRGQYKWTKLNLSELIKTPGDTKTLPDGGFQIEVPPNADDTELHFGLYEVWSRKWKGGLQIHEAVVEEVIR